MTARRCNECTLCCKLMPVSEIGKAAGTRCRFQRAKGCTVYHDHAAGFPRSCAQWSCAWLLNVEGMADMPRPDRARYVIDTVPDYVEAEAVLGQRARMGVVQIWIDPAHPEVHRDPKLRAWIELQAKTTKFAALIRFNSYDALFLLPPSLSGDGQWHEKAGTPTGEDHTLCDITDTLRALDP